MNIYIYIYISLSFFCIKEIFYYYKQKKNEENKEFVHMCILIYNLCQYCILYRHLQFTR